ncbi:MAG: hypothetical protein ACRDGS_09590 [Chloroflexota bacterium]
MSSQKKCDRYNFPVSRTATSLALLALGAIVCRDQGSAGAAGFHQRIRVEEPHGASAGLQHRVSKLLPRLSKRIDSDFHVRPTGQLTVVLYSSHTAFARAMFRNERLWPQGRLDNVANVTRSVLPLGPAIPRLAHSLAHVYTEWILDRLTHNSSDRQPNPAWLYDGLAEWEADHASRPVACSIPAAYPLSLASLASPERWRALRSGALGGLEYCEARTGAGRLISRVGWPRLIHLLHASHSWHGFVRDTRFACGGRRWPACVARR